MAVQVTRLRDRLHRYAATPAETMVATPAETMAATPAETMAATPAETVEATPAETVAATPAETMVKRPLGDERVAHMLDKANAARSSERSVPALVDKRKAPRKMSSLPAFINVDGRQRMISCTIIDMSATGARLQILCKDRHIRENILGFPNIITLFITFDKLRVDCEIAWRNSAQDRIGLRFLSVPQSYS